MSSSNSDKGINLSETRYEIPSDHEDKGFVIIRQPERTWNVSKDNKLAQRDLKREDIKVMDYAPWIEREVEGKKK